jgi:uncharacterized protein
MAAGGHFLPAWFPEEPTMDTSLNLIVKSTRKCNLRCSYCHDWRSKASVIGFEVLANLVAKALRSHQYRLVNFIWHGGEPLLLGLDFFKTALTLQEAFIRSNQYVTNSIQINGTLLTDEWCQFFKRNKFNVGISVDGPEELHNRNRSYASGMGSFQDVVRSIEMLKAHDLPFGVLLVLNDNTRRLSVPAIFDFVVDDLRVTNFSFLPAVPDNIPSEKSGERYTTDYFPMDDYEDFMIALFDYWYALDNPEIRVRELEGIVRSILRGNPQVCTLAGNCLGSNYHIEADGDVYHCDKYLGDKDYRVGNILVDDFEGILRTQQFQLLQERERDSLARLASCAFFDICNGGCPHDRYIARKYQPTYDDACCGQSRLIAHIKTVLGQRIGDENMALLGHPVRLSLAAG